MFDSIYFFFLSVIVVWMRTQKGRCFHFRGKKLLQNDGKNELSLLIICENAVAWALYGSCKLSASVFF